MLTFLSCSKRLGGADEVDSARGDPGLKETSKSLTSQIKRMVLKLSTSSRTGKQEETNCSAARLGFQEVGELFLKKQQRQQDASFDVLPEDVRGNSNEWMALVEPGVLITFTSLPGGLNHLKRIRFREMFDKWQAQRWWGENYDRVMELYNVQSFSRPGLHSPHRPENEFRRSAGEADVASRTTTSSTSSDVDAAEWVLQDYPGVFVTVRQVHDGPRELRRVKFSRQYFSEARAKQWWEENWERIQAQYL